MSKKSKKRNYKNKSNNKSNVVVTNHNPIDKFVDMYEFAEINDMYYMIVNNELISIESKKVNALALKFMLDETGKLNKTEANNMLEVVKLNLSLGEYKTRTYDDIHRRVIFNESNKSLIYNLDNSGKEVVLVTPNAKSIIKKASRDLCNLSSLNGKGQILPLANPTKTLLQDFKALFNYANSGDVVLHAVWVVASLFNTINSPILLLNGQKGSTKTTMASLTKMIIDPSETVHSSLPTAQEAFAVKVSSEYVSVFDNVDKISSRISDLLCLSTTGGSLSKRKAYTNDELSSIDLTSKLIMTSTSIPSAKSDLMDRLLTIEVKRPTGNRTQSEIQKDFADRLPNILECVFEVVKKVLMSYDKEIDYKLSRLADYHRIGILIAEALGVDADDYNRLYTERIKETAQMMAESPVVESITRFIDQNGDFEGTTSELMEKITKLFGKKPVGVPSTTNLFSREINKLVSNFESLGYEVKKFKQRIWEIKKKK